MKRDARLDEEEREEEINITQRLAACDIKLTDVISGRVRLVLVPSLAYLWPW